jgi:hypothetical protein
VIGLHPAATKATKPVAQGSALVAAVAACERPSHVYYDPHFLDQFYSAVKQDLLAGFPHLVTLRPSLDLEMAMSIKRRELTSRLHNDEMACITLDQFDLVEPTIRAVEQISNSVSQPTRLQYNVVGSAPEIDLTIDELDELQIPDRRLVFAHRSMSVAAKIQHFQACVDYARGTSVLDYVAACEMTGGAARTPANRANTTLATVRLFGPLIALCSQSLTSSGSVCSETKSRSQFSPTTSTSSFANFCPGHKLPLVCQAARIPIEADLLCFDCPECIPASAPTRRYRPSWPHFC